MRGLFMMRSLRLRANMIIKCWAVKTARGNVQNSSSRSHRHGTSAAFRRQTPLPRCGLRPNLEQTGLWEGSGKIVDEALGNKIT